MSLTPGTTIGPYEILSLLGSGGMGDVYRARDRRLDRDLAIKVLSKEAVTRADALPRFEREAKAASALNHPHILHIYDIGNDGGVNYIAMELVEGQTLRRSITHSTGSGEMLGWLTQVAEALGKAHAAGIVHRDLKPENIMISEDGYAKVLDFGLAKLLQLSPQSDDDHTAIRSLESTPGMVMGTLGYMAPEQAMGLEVDHRVDIYSFGCILHEAFGEDAGVREISARCLERDRERRYQSFRDVLADLKRTSTTTSPPTPVAQETRSIAVLPFDDLSAARDSEYLGDGVAEEIITDLSRIETLRVVARSSAAHLKASGAAVPQIASALHVSYVVTGSVRRAGERLRIAAQLIDAAAESTIWAEKFDGTMDDIFDIQEKVARSIASELRLKLTSVESDRMRERPVADVRAYESYLRARKLMYEFDESSLDAAQAEIDRALEIAGENPALLATRGIILWQYWNAGVSQDVAVLDRAEEIAKRVLQIDPGSARGRALLGMVAIHRGDVPGAIRHLREAVERDANELDALSWLTVIYCLAGQTDKARPMGMRLASIDPFSWFGQLGMTVVELMDGDFEKALATVSSMEAVFSLKNMLIVLMLLLMRRTDEAEKNAETMLRESPDDPFARIGMALVLAIREEREKSLSMLTPEVEATAAADLQYASWIADVYALLGDAEKTASWLRIALSRGYLAYPYLARHDWFLDGVRSSPEVREALEEIREGWEGFRA
ncbi:MAG TPA: protein kinase [Thermoanaerobaculia bacterium]|nr:protein kinase [Thermoanaerobaculia bacterium]